MSEEDIKAGFYKSKAVPGSQQFGFAKEGGQQVAVAVHLVEIDRTVATIMAYSGGAIPITIERLKTMGVKDFRTFEGLGDTEFTSQIKYETNPKTNEVNMKCEVKSREQTFSFKAPMNEQQENGFKEELARMAAQLDSQKGGPGAANAPKGYSQSWDQNAPPAGAAPKVDLG